MATAMSDILFGDRAPESKMASDSPKLNSDVQEAKSTESIEKKADPAEEKKEVENVIKKDDAKNDKVNEATAKDNDDTDDEVLPDDIEKLKKALKAARGDKRYHRKRWHETDEQLSKLSAKLASYEERDRIFQYQQQQQQQLLLQQQQQKAAPKPLDLTEEDFYGKGPTAVKSYIDQAIASERERLNSQLGASQERYNRLLVNFARQRHNDYDETVKIFAGGPVPQPILDQVINAEDPAETFYQCAKTYGRLKNVKSIEEYEQQVRAEIEKEVTEKLEAKYKNIKTESRNQNQLPSVPQSLANARGISSGQPTGWSGPTPFSEILGVR
ncbi:MAG: hypothetical protein QXN55_07305 [Candidatus Nitrosotenuis sp.]